MVAVPTVSRAQTLLLRAALLPGAAGTTALDAWRTESAVASPLDAPSRRLLPLLWRNHPEAAELVPLARDAYRASWAENQRRLDLAAPFVAALETAGIPTLLFKGAGLALHAYAGLGLRPLGDVDVLVPDADWDRARAILAARGAPAADAVGAARGRLLHAVAHSIDGAGLEIDLHRAALWETRQRTGDALANELWERAVPISGPGFTSRTFDATDHLIVVCAHGLRWSPSPAIHWAADAVTLLTGREAIQWGRLVDDAAAWGLALPIAVALRWLREVLDAPVDGAALAALERRTAGWRGRVDRLELRARARPPALGRGLFLHWCDHRRARPRATVLGRLATFPLYLSGMWDVERLVSLPLVAARKTAARLAR
jgi:hypothetical protein